MTNNTKTCTKCGEAKTQDWFYTSSQSRVCKVCHRADMREYATRNREKVRALAEDWRSENEGHTYVDGTTGYVMYVGYKAPGANPSGITRLHRLVLWEKLNGQDSPCHWCGKSLTWGDNLTTDHVNGVRDDNRPENLVPSCQPCNARRSRHGKAPRVCSLPECSRPHSAKGLCASHYRMQYEGRDFKPVQRRLSKEDKNQLVADIKSGMTVVETARKFDLDTSAVSRHYKKITGQSIRDFRLRPEEAA